MTIPRFNAQIQSLQVPSMRDYQAEQNASIAQSLANFSKKILGITSSIMENKKENEYYQMYGRMVEETNKNQKGGQDNV